jgi:low affinity Fe/Cu permease
VRPTKSTSLFTRFAKWTARASGRPVTFALALMVILIWACFGPYFHWSDTHQLIINTSTTIVTFLMVFLIQNTQNRDTEALQVKLDELIRVTKGAHLVLLDLEELDDKQLDSIYETYEELAAKAREDAERGKEDTGTPELNLEEGQAFERSKKSKGKKKK